MSWQDDVMIEQEATDALSCMGEAEWRDMYGEKKRGRGRPRKSEEEKRANRAKYQKEYWQKWKANITEEQKQKRKEQSRRSHDKWVKSHRDEWSAYMREYRRRKKEETKENKNAQQKSA